MRGWKSGKVIALYTHAHTRTVRIPLCTIHYLFIYSEHKRGRIVKYVLRYCYGKYASIILRAPNTVYAHHPNAYIYVRILISIYTLDARKVFKYLSGRQLS